MATRSAIEWTQATWNPVTGCTKVSAGCEHCYAERMALRLQAMGQPKYRDGFAVRTHGRVLELPLTWKRPHEVFVNSMGDLFHDEVPFEFIARVFDVMRQAHQHRFQLLTKRSVRVRELAPRLDWPDNVWMGVTVEDARAMSRIGDLRAADGPALRWLCCEPLLGPLAGLDLTGIDWVIVGGESGPQARPMKEEWVLAIRDACLQAVVPFFFKQWGGTSRKQAGPLLDGAEWPQRPESPANRQTEFELEAAV